MGDPYSAERDDDDGEDWAVLSGDAGGDDPPPWLAEMDADREPIRHGVKISAKIKRGTDTRDQDEIKLVGRGEDATAAAADFEAALQRVESRNWVERLRALQTEESDG